MAIIASLAGAVGRFAGKIVNAALGWASILLFGRVPQQKQILLSFVTLGSIVWVVAILGVIFPDLGTFLIALVPAPKFIDRNLIRLAMLVVAVVLPLFVGIASLFIVKRSDRPAGTAIVPAILRGYPFCLVLAFTLVFLAVVALVRKIRAMAKRWEDAHVPIVVKPGGYGQLVDDLCDGLQASRLDVSPKPAPEILALPARLLAAVSGSSVRSLVPDRLMQVTGPNLEVLVHPSDIAIAGSKKDVARAHAAIASRLTAAPAYLTTTAESQAVEDRIEAIAGEARQVRQAGGPARARGTIERAERDLRSVDEALADLVVPYDEWEVLYRMRLQVERELLTGEAPGETLAGGLEGAAPGAPAPVPQPVLPSRVLQWAASGLGLVLIGLDVVLSIADRIAPEPPTGVARIVRRLRSR